MAKSLPRPPADAASRSLRQRRAAGGFVLGVLTWTALAALGIEFLPALRHRWEWLSLPAALAGAAIALTPARRLLWALAGTVAGLVLLVGCTPLVQPLMRRLV